MEIIGLQEKFVSHVWVFENMNTALQYAFQHFPNGASVEALHWFLCLSTILKAKTITSNSVSRELSRRPDLFVHLVCAKYSLNRSNIPVPTSFSNSAPPKILLPQIQPQYQNQAYPQMIPNYQPHLPKDSLELSLSTCS